MKKFRLFGLLVFLGLVAFTGCNKEPNDSPKAHGRPEKVSHEHGTGPHGGTVFDFGRWHAEFTVSHKDQEATVYILGSDEKTRTAIPVETLLLSIKNPQFQVELKAAPQEGDPSGKASRFVGKDQHFGKEQEFEGTLSGAVNGKPYAGDFKEQPEKKERK